MPEMMSLELAKQRRQELLREAELRRRAKALRAAHKGDAIRRSALVCMGDEEASRTSLQVFEKGFETYRLGRQEVYN
jgi:hypothetical protein